MGSGQWEANPLRLLPPVAATSPEGRGFGSTAKLLVLPRALPLGELSPEVTEKARALSAAQQKALPSGELSSGCETERVCVAAFARRPWMLLLAVLSMPSPGRGKVSRNAVTRRMRAHRQMLLLVTHPSSVCSRWSQPPVPLLALRATSPGAGESFPKGGRL